MIVFMNAWFSRFARKERISKQVLLQAVARAQKGVIDANLGGGVIKQRIARQGQGSSGGYRSILLFQKNERCFFVYGYSKSVLSNISAEEQRAFKLMASYVMNLTAEQMTALVANGEFEEVT
jgi:hypothetical protein